MYWNDNQYHHFVNQFCFEKNTPVQVAISLLATVKAAWSVPSISDKNKGITDFHQWSGNSVYLIIIFKYFIYFHYLYTMNIHIHSWFSLITSFCSKGSTKLCSFWLLLKVGSFCYSKCFFFILSSLLRALPQGQLLYVIYMTDNLSNHKLLLESKAACCCLQWSEETQC